MISPIFTTIVISFLIIMAYMKITTNRFSTGDEERLETERKSNSVRRKSLDELEYITIPFDSLPFSSKAEGSSASGPIKDENATPVGNEDAAILKDEEDVLALKDKRIVNFTGISNTDLKFTYGAPNLPILTEYDQNFTELVRALDSWGTHLMQHGRKDEARKVFEFAADCRSDLKSSYIQLADIYAENFEFEKLDRLIEIAEGLNSLMKGPIVRALKDKCDINKYVVKKSPGD